MERKTKGFEEVQANGLVLLEAPVGLLNSFRDRLGELLEFDKKGLVLAPLNTDPGAGRGFPNGFVEPLGGGQKTDYLGVIYITYQIEVLKINF